MRNGFINMEIFLKNTEQGLIPLYESDETDKKKLKLDEVYKVTIKRSRNYEFHKKYFALIKLAFDNYSTDMPFDTFRKWLQMKAGFVKAYQTGKGIFYDTVSISFESMDNDTFNEVYDKVLDTVVALLKSDKELIEKELINFM